MLDGVLMTFSVVSQMLAREMRSGYNIMSGYGGGFEVATFADGRFRKIGDVLHLSWICVKDKQGYDIELVPIAYKLDYLNDELLIRRLQFGDFNKKYQNLPIKSNDMFAVGSLINRVSRKITVDELPDWNATYFINHLYMRDGDEEKERRIIVSYSPERSGPVKFIGIGKTMVVAVNMTFMRRCVMAGI